MSETKKTAVFLATGLVLSILAFLTAPSRIVPEAFQDQGEKFFPGFDNPNEATSLEVIEFDSTTNTATPFKVMQSEGKWTIPSHNNYPADGKDRLAKTAAGIIDIAKDDFRTDASQEYEALGVVDPVDDPATGVGRGKRVTMKAADGRILADFIIGKPVPGKDKFSYVRIPNEKRVYAARVDVDISTRFEDWIESDLLKISKDQIHKINLKDYSVNERTFNVDKREDFNLARSGSSWRFDKGGKTDSAKMEQILLTLDELKIVGVRPKPKGLSEVLAGTAQTPTINQSDIVSLQSKGYYLTREGQLLANEGELLFSTDAGLRYTLRFGEVAYGTGEALTAGSATEGTPKSGAAENRYLFVSVDSDLSSLKEPPRATDMSFQQKPDSLHSETDKKQKEIHLTWSAWKEKVDNSRKHVQDLNVRFSNWYYVISSDSFEKLKLSRRQLQGS